MKIDSTLKPSMASPGIRPAAAQTGQRSATTDSVNLSALASTLQDASLPPVNSARVQEIKDAIAQGQFKINPEAIAEGVIASARELINSQRQA